MVEKDIMEKLCESDFVCSDVFFSDEKQQEYYICDSSSISAEISKIVLKHVQDDIGGVIKFSFDSSLHIFFEITNKGNGHLFLPLSNNLYKAVKIYDAGDDEYIYISYLADISTKDMNNDGLSDFIIFITLKNMDGNIYYISRCFLQIEKGFFCELNQGKHASKRIF